MVTTIHRRDAVNVETVNRYCLAWFGSLRLSYHADVVPSKYLRERKPWSCGEKDVMASWLIRCILVLASAAEKRRGKRDLELLRAC